MARKWNSNALEGDGEGVGFSFSLPDEKSSISGDPHQVILRLTPAQVAVEPPTEHRNAPMLLRNRKKN